MTPKKIKKIEIILRIKEYFYWVDTEKKYPSAGFAGPRKQAENKLREIMEDYETNN